MKSILEIKNLKVFFDTLHGGKVHAINDVNISVFPKETLAIVGESGSGKTQLALSILNLLAKNANTSGEINFEGKNILSMSKDEINKIRGSSISMIFQDPMTSLNPYLRVSTQMTEILVEKQGLSLAEARSKSIDMLKNLSISEPEKRIDQYPHQFSGGMRQRIMISMALLSNPKILLADEPTTALDVTIQAQILDILAKLKEQFNLAIIFVTHDLAVVSDIADKIAVFYGGQIVEYGTKKDIFENPKHPYTIALLKSMPGLQNNRNDRLFSIEGYPKTLNSEPNLCVFKDRCTVAMDKCGLINPKYKEVGVTHRYKCLLENTNGK
jgi:oligopeptide transport system ATP-binding protein